MSLPEHIQEWLKSHYHDKKIMEEIQTFLLELQTSERTSVCLVDQVRRILKSSNLSEIKATDVAMLLRMSQRSMNRKLRAENTTFYRLLDEERRKRYLMIMRARERLTYAQIAPLIGFADEKSVYRASKRWAKKGSR